MLLFRNVSGEGEYSVSLEQMQAAMPKWQAWINSLAEQGKFVSTQPLEYEGRVVRRQTVTDGPFAEVKELVVGYLVCKAEGIEEAIRISQGCPVLDYPGGSVEVRPLTPNAV